MDVKMLEYLMVIEEEGTLSQAAEKIHISQSALSQNLAKIEKELGGPIFHRVDKKMVPTEIGEIYLRNAKEMIYIKQRTYQKIQHIANQYMKSVRIAICPQVYETAGHQILSALRKNVTQCHLDFHVADSMLAKEYLLNDVVDAAILCTNGALHSLLVFDNLYEEYLVLTVPRDMAWEGRDINMSELKKCSFVYPAKETFLHPIVHSVMEEKQIIADNVYNAKEIRGMKMLVEQGYGAAFLPSRIAVTAKECVLYAWNPGLSYLVDFSYSKYASNRLILQQISRILKECLAGEEKTESKCCIR